MPSAPKTSTGFVGLSDYLGANAPAVQNTANRVASNVNQQGTRAQSGMLGVARNAYNDAERTGVANPTGADGYQNAQAEDSRVASLARGLPTFGGLSGQLQTQFGGPGVGYTAGDRSFDANLVGAGGQPQIRATAGHFGGLDNFLGQYANAWAAEGAKRYTPPPTPAPKTPAVDNGPATPETPEDREKVANKTRPNGPRNPFAPGGANGGIF